MSKKKRFLFIFGYICFLTFLLEGTARIAFWIPPISKRLQADEDYSWQRNWVHRHQTSGMEIYYKFDIYDSSKGWMSKPNLRDMKVFDNKILNTNDKGFRGKKDFPYKKNEDRLRILILGDSFTFGDYVSDNETYSHYLQELLPHVEIINLGVHGYGHDQMLILLKEVGVKYKPDIVIIGFLHVDMPRNLLRFRDFAKPKFVFNKGEIELTGIPVPRPEDILQSDWKRPRIIDLFSIVNYQFRAKSGLLKKEMETVTTAILMDMINVIESIRAIPILVYLPQEKEISLTPAVTPKEEYMLSVCKMIQKAECFSARPYFAEKIAKGQSFKSIGHWDPIGHRTVAEAIKEYLVNKKFIAMPSGDL